MRIFRQEFSVEIMSEKPKINLLKEVLKEKGIKHNEFAERMGVSPNTITRICNNVQQPHLEFLRKMAIELNVEVCELIVPIESK